MELPIYYTFSEFEDNYNEIFQNWKKAYSEGDEEDFMKQYKEKYHSCVQYDERSDEVYMYDNIEIREEDETFFWGYISINFHEFAKILQKRIEDYIDRKKILIENIDDYSHYVDNVEMFEDSCVFSEKETTDPYLIRYYQYYKIKDFFEVKEIVSSEGIRYIISFNEIKYKNFKYSIPKIFKFFKDKIYKKNLRPEDKKEEHIIPAIPAPLPEPKNNKIRIHGSTQLFGYIFSELISKGYIAPEEKQGNGNVAATARLILDHFEFLDTEKQPGVEYLRKALFEQNSLSSEKQNLFKIPYFNKVK